MMFGRTLFTPLNKVELQWFFNHVTSLMPKRKENVSDDLEAGTVHPIQNVIITILF